MSCAICGAETAASVYRCALHWRPSYYVGRTTPEQALARRSVESELSGEMRASAGQLSRADVLAQLVACGEAGATIAEIRARLPGSAPNAIQGALTGLRRAGHARHGSEREAEQRLRWWATDAGTRDSVARSAIAARVRALLSDGRWRSADEVARALGARPGPVANALSNWCSVGRAIKDTAGQRVRYRLLGGAA